MKRMKKMKMTRNRATAIRSESTLSTGREHLHLPSGQAPFRGSPRDVLAPKALERTKVQPPLQLARAPKLYTDRASLIRDSFGGDKFGRSSTARRRVDRECTAPVQAQGADRGHHQGSQTSLLLSEAGRQAPSETGVGSQTCAKEVSQGTRLVLHVFKTKRAATSQWCRGLSLLPNRPSEARIPPLSA
jgi:hypothetical protein